LAAVLAAAAWPALTSARLAGQQPASGGPRPAGTESTASSVASVRIDAVVTDAQGRPILDLRPSDFELIENGVPVPAGSVELRTLPGAAVTDIGPIETEADEEMAARQPGARLFAFFLDEFHVSPGAGSDRVRAALRRFVDERLAPQDLALVMRPLEPMTSIRFTRDRASLRAAIDRFEGRKGDYAPRSTFEEQYIGRAPQAVTAARRQIVAAGLRELTMRMGELGADRGVVVLVSGGFSRDSPAPRGRGADLQGVVRASSRFHLAMYTFSPAAGDGNADPDPERERASSMLQWLAAQTGGRATVEAEDLTPGLERMAADLAAYYALTFPPAQTDGRFHTVEVRARRRDAQVRARPGYWAPLGSELRALTSTMTSISRRGLRRSPVIDAWVGLMRDPSGRARMVITWEPRARGPAAPEVVVVKARTTAGAALFDGQVARVGAAGAAPADSARFDVPAGRIELDMTIIDAEGKVLDTDARDFDVPDLRSQTRGPVLLTPEVVRARTLPDFRTASTNPNAAPSSVRTFARGDRLLIRVPAFDGSGTAVRVTAKVLNDRGQPMRDIDATAGAPREGVTEFALPLSWLVPGEYLIELLGTNANGVVTQRVAFRVTG
jgi:VWFA-related protein